MSSVFFKSNYSRVRNNFIVWLVCALTTVALWGTLCVHSTHAQDEPATEEKEESTEKKAETDDEVTVPPKLEEMELPSDSQLLKGPVVDWVVLKEEDRVIVTQPLDPRPNTLEFIEQRVKDPAKHEPAELQFDDEGNELDNAALARVRRAWRQTLPYLTVYLATDPESDVKDADEEDHKYLLHNRYIKEIIYFEDLMLKRVDEYLDNKQISEAYELLVAVRWRDPKWSGAEKRQQRLLFAESEVYLDKERAEFAFVNLELLHNQASDYPNLSREMGKVADQLIARADSASDYRRARHFLNRFQKRYPEHSITTKWTESFASRAATLVTEAREADKQGQIEGALAKAERATQLWPDTEGLNNVYRSLARRHQILRVGVLLQPADGATKATETVADSRRRQLTFSSLFEPDEWNGEIVRYRTRFFTQWKPTGLGRRINFQLRQHRQPWESQEITFAGPLIRRFSEMLNPTHAAYDERFAAGVSEVSLKSPFEFTVQFHNIPLRPEPLFAQATNIPGPFTLDKQEAGKTIYRRAIPEPTDEKQLHVAEIIEIKYDSYEKAFQGLLRGEVSMLPHVPVARVDRLLEDSSFFVQKYQLPVTHLIQFNPQNKSLRNRSLRRALAYAINTRRILDEQILKNPASDKGRLTSAPFPSTNYAYAKDIVPHKYDIALAAAMMIAARKDLGNTLPQLRLLCPPESFSREVAKRLIAAWSQIGIKVTLISADQKTRDAVTDQDWDLVYRKISMHEPAAELWPLLALQSTAQVSSLAHLPNWLRQEIMELDRTSNWSRARVLLHRLHRHLLNEMQLIPLWEVDDYLAIRKTVRGIPANPIVTYDGITQWTVQPWYSRRQP